MDFPERVVSKHKAIVSSLPVMSGDGYGWGGEAVLTIGDQSVVIGDIALAEEIAERWNAFSDKAT